MKFTSSQLAYATFAFCNVFGGALWVFTCVGAGYMSAILTW